MAKLNSSGIQSVGGLAIIVDNMELYWNLCQIENGYQMLLEMIPCINRIKITKGQIEINFQDLSNLQTSNFRYQQSTYRKNFLKQINNKHNLGRLRVERVLENVRNCRKCSKLAIASGESC